MKNIQLKVSDVHIRWEDDGGILGSCVKDAATGVAGDRAAGFAVGAYMKHCSVVTTDASGRVMFEHAAEQLFKSTEMDGCSIYCDSMEEPHTPSENMPLLATYQPESTTLATRHRYLLQPCSIRCSVAIFRPVSAESVFGDDDELPVLRHRVVLQLAESCPRLELRFSLCNHDGQVARLE